MTRKTAPTGDFFVLQMGPFNKAYAKVRPQNEDMPIELVIGPSDSLMTLVCDAPNVRREARLSIKASFNFALGENLVLKTNAAFFNKVLFPARGGASISDDEEVRFDFGGKLEPSHETKSLNALIKVGSLRVSWNFAISRSPKIAASPSSNERIAPDVLAKAITLVRPFAESGKNLGQSPDLTIACGHGFAQAAKMEGLRVVRHKLLKSCLSFPAGAAPDVIRFLTKMHKTETFFIDDDKHFLITDAAGHVRLSKREPVALLLEHERILLGTVQPTDLSQTLVRIIRQLRQNIYDVRLSVEPFSYLRLAVDVDGGIAEAGCKLTGLQEQSSEAPLHTAVYDARLLALLPAGGRNGLIEISLLKGYLCFIEQFDDFEVQTILHPMSKKLSKTVL